MLFLITKLKLKLSASECPRGHEANEDARNVARITEPIRDRSKGASPRKENSDNRAVYKEIINRIRKIADANNREIT